MQSHTLGGQSHASSWKKATWHSHSPLSHSHAYPALLQTNISSASKQEPQLLIHGNFSSSLISYPPKSGFASTSVLVGHLLCVSHSTMSVGTVHSPPMAAHFKVRLVIKSVFTPIWCHMLWFRFLWITLPGDNRTRASAPGLCCGRFCGWDVGQGCVLL